MAEFCLDCLNKLDGTNLTEEDVILEDDFCEECGRYVPCVVRYRTPGERFFLFPSTMLHVLRDAVFTLKDFIISRCRKKRKR